MHAVAPAPLNPTFDVMATSPRRVAVVTAAAVATAASALVAVAASHTDTAPPPPVTGVQVLSLATDCGAVCQATVVAALQSGGCGDLRLFGALRMVAARCPLKDSSPSPPASVRAAAYSTASAKTAAWMGALPGVTAVDADAVGHGDAPAPTATMATAAARRSPPPYFWHRDRVNQHDLPLDGVVNSTACYPARGAGVLVFVADTGIAAGHTEFGSRAIAMPGPGSPYSSGNDDNGHGTHTAGIACGATAGVAPGATLMAVKILDGHDTGAGADLIAALDYAATLKALDAAAKVVFSASVQGFGPASTTAADRAAAAGVIVVVSAGNREGVGADAAGDACASHPAAARRAITVAAADSADALSGDSNAGPCVDVIAPGVHVLSADAFWLPGGLARRSGTSMAAPVVAGLAALVLAEESEGGNMTGADVLARLTAGAPTVGGFPLAWANPDCKCAR